jgi:hypothetical protein
MFAPAQPEINFEAARSCWCDLAGNVAPTAFGVSDVRLAFGSSPAKMASKGLPACILAGRQLRGFDRPTNPLPSRIEPSEVAPIGSQSAAHLRNQFRPAIENGKDLVAALRRQTDIHPGGTQRAKLFKLCRIFRRPANRQRQ